MRGIRPAGSSSSRRDGAPSTRHSGPRSAGPSAGGRRRGDGADGPSATG
jgi:hypothetical protein